MRHMPSLKSLRAFDAVARLKSVSAAANELSVTPSAVSRQISNLEDNVGVALLRREGRGCCLTADGKRLESELSDAFDRIVQAVDRFRQPARGTRLRLRCGPMIASSWLMPRLAQFHRESPDTDVVLIALDERVTTVSDADLAIDWGVFESDTRVTAERLTQSEEIFPVCRPEVCPDGNLATANLLHLECSGIAWNWPDWATFFNAVGLSPPLWKAPIWSRGCCRTRCVWATELRSLAPRSPMTILHRVPSFAPLPRV